MDNRRGLQNWSENILIVPRWWAAVCVIKPSSPFISHGPQPNQNPKVCLKGGFCHLVFNHTGVCSNIHCSVQLFHAIKTGWNVIIGSFYVDSFLLATGLEGVYTKIRLCQQWLHCPVATTQTLAPNDVNKTRWQPYSILDVLASFNKVEGTHATSSIFLLQPTIDVRRQQPMKKQQGEMVCSGLLIWLVCLRDLNQLSALEDQGFSLVRPSINPR